MIFRGLKYKLKPSAGQEKALSEFSGVCRLVYNLGFEQRCIWYRQVKKNTGHNISYPFQCRELTDLREQFDWIAAVSSACQQQALRDLDRAFERYFKGIGKFPSPRKKGINDSFRVVWRDSGVKSINRKWAAVRLPKIGWVKFRDTRPRIGAINNVTVILEASGWHVSFACEIESAKQANLHNSVGIDRGVMNTLTLSTGEHLSVPSSLLAIESRKRRAQKTLARRKRGSQRRLKALRRVASLSARIARVRRDWHHKSALIIASRFGTVVLEDLRIRNMTASAKGTVEAPGTNVRQKAGLNRSILNQGWGSFETILAYKLEERGGHLCKVDPRYTSQTCSECGAIDRKSRESQANFSCQHCGHRAHADVNAAINILRRNTASTRMEDGRWAADEVRTGKRCEPLENPSAFASERKMLTPNPSALGRKEKSHLKAGKQ